MAANVIYKPKPLCHSTRQIRLVKLCPSKYGRIDCELQVHDLEQSPHFLALSYVWGPTHPTKIILLDDHEFYIRQNLFSFLEMFSSKSMDDHLRRALPADSPSFVMYPILDCSGWFMFEYKSQPWPLLWIDALCINQQDDDERSLQVSYMADIFKKARGVITWLGPSTSGTELAFGFVRNLFQERRLEGYICDRSFTKTSQPDIVGLLSNAYWSRAWTVQEFMLATNSVICCGEYWTDWSNVSAAEMYSEGALGTLGFRYLEWKLAFVQHFRLPLIFAMALWKNQQCQDPRDKVYALLGMSVTDKPLHPDYSKSTMSLFADILECHNLIIIPTYFRYVSGPLIGCNYTQDLGGAVGRTWTLGGFKLGMDTVIEILKLNPDNPEVKRGAKTALEEGKHGSFEVYVCVYPQCKGKWKDADAFHNDHEDRVYEADRKSSGEDSFGSELRPA